MSQATNKLLKIKCVKAGPIMASFSKTLTARQCWKNLGFLEEVFRFLSFFLDLLYK